MSEKKSLFPERLKAARELRKLTQSELGERSGIPASSISNFESDSRKPSFDSLKKLAATLEVTTDYLLGTASEENISSEQQNRESDTRPRYIKEVITKLVIDGSLFATGRISEIINQVKDVSVGVSSYQQRFAQEAKEEEMKNNHSFADTFQILYIVCDFWLQSGDIKNPFHPRSWMGNARSPVPDDLTEQQIFQLGAAIDYLDDFLMIARLADVVWVKLKKVNFAHRAISSYLESAKDDRVMEMERFWYLERACRLSIQVNSQELQAECKKAFDAFLKNAPFYEILNISLLSLGQTLRLLEPEDLVKEAVSEAEKTHNTNPHATKELLLIAAHISKKLGNIEKASGYYRKIHDSYLKFANQMDAIGSISFIEEAITALRLAGGAKSEIQALNRLLLERGQKSLGEMKTPRSPRIDFSQTVQAAKKLVEGLSPIEALIRISDEFPNLKYANYKMQVEESVKNHPLRYFIGATSISQDGRQYFKRGSFLSDNPEERSKALDAEISSMMTREILLIVQFCLLPALGELHWTTRDYNSLFNMIARRPIVPEGREGFYFAGIKAGIDGDFLIAAHLLIPQLENSLRFVLERQGFVVTSLDSENLHSEISINKVFETYRTELVKIFGSEDLIFIMESFLCLKTGENFRNEMCHGLVNNVRDLRFVVIWWLTLNLLFLENE